MDGSRPTYRLHSKTKILEASGSSNVPSFRSVASMDRAQPRPVDTSPIACSTRSSTCSTSATTGPRRSTTRSERVLKGYAWIRGRGAEEARSGLRSAAATARSNASRPGAATSCTPTRQPFGRPREGQRDRRLPGRVPRLGESHVGGHPLQQLERRQAFRVEIAEPRRGLGDRRCDDEVEGLEPTQGSARSSPH